MRMNCSFKGSCYVYIKHYKLEVISVGATTKSIMFSGSLFLTEFVTCPLNENDIKNENEIQNRQAKKVMQLRKGPSACCLYKGRKKE